MRNLILISVLLFNVALLSQDIEKISSQANEYYYSKQYQQSIEQCKIGLAISGDDKGTLLYKSFICEVLCRIYKTEKFEGYNMNLSYSYLKKASEFNNQYLIKCGKTLSEKTKLEKELESMTQLYPGCDKVKIEVTTENAKTQTNTESNDKTVTITVTGQGKTQDEAKQNAFRSAIEQAFGAFISSKTEILNDNLVKDEIISIANGNIQKFEVISEVQIPDGGYATSLKATVSVTKLTSFVESKGVVAEFKGNILAANIKQQMLNEQNETKAIQNITNTCKEILDLSCDFEIVRGEPKQKNNDNNQWAVPVTINVKFNKNIEQFNQYLFNSVNGLTMTLDEVNQYKQLGKKTYKLVIGGGSVGGTSDNTEFIKALANSNPNLRYKILFDEQILFESNDSKLITKEFNKQIKKENTGRGGSLSDYQTNSQISERIKRYKIQYYDQSINPIYYFRSFSTIVSIIDLIYYTKHAVLNFEVSNGINTITSEKLFADLKEHQIINGNGNVSRYSAGCSGFKLIKDNLAPIFNYSHPNYGHGPSGLFDKQYEESFLSPYENINNKNIRFLNDFSYDGNRSIEYKAVIDEKYGFLIQAENILISEQKNIHNRYDKFDNDYKAVISLFDYKYSDKNIETFYFDDIHTLSDLEKIHEYKIKPIKD